MKGKYDVVVIGAGVAGLATAALASHAGKKVLVFEKESGTGGSCLTIERAGFKFDLGLSSIPGYSGGVVRDFLGKIRADLTLIPIEPIDHLIFPEITLEIPSDIDQLITLLSNNFPEESNNLRRFFKVLLEIRNELASEVNRRELIGMYKGFTFEQMLTSFFNDLWLKRILGGQWHLVGLPPGQVSALAMCNILGEPLRFGLGLPAGGIGSFASSILKSFKDSGGQIRFDSEVTEIITEDGRAVGVRTDSGEEVSAPVVVSCIDARKTFFNLVKEKIHSNYLDKLKELKVSKPVFQMHLGLTPDANMREVKNGIYLFEESNTWVRISSPTKWDNSLAPPKHHVIKATVPILDEEPIADWDGWKDLMAQRTLQSLQGLIPNLKDNIVTTFVETPSENETRTGNSSGAAFGWALTPDQYGDERLSQVTPIKNLYLAGHWSAPGAGLADVIRSARAVAKFIVS